MFPEVVFSKHFAGIKHRLFVESAIHQRGGDTDFNMKILTMIIIAVRIKINKFFNEKQFSLLPQNPSNSQKNSVLKPAVSKLGFYQVVSTGHR